MATMENKENFAPTSSDPLQHKSSSPGSKRAPKKGRSKSIGPGGLEEAEAPKQLKPDLKNRRKSTYVPATKSILFNEAERAERKAARGKANRRVSFAPEATLHTWDVIEFMRDPTTSTDSSDSTRRTSNITRSSNRGSPFKSPQNIDSDPPSTPPEQEASPAKIPPSPAPQRDLHQKKRRRSSGIPPMNFNNPEDASSPSGVSGSSDVSESEDEEDAPGSDEDDTGTAMSLDVDNNTVQSLADSESSTGSSARLEAALKQAATQAGTRGIVFDEFGDASMELAGDDVTNALKPWAEQRNANEPLGSASLDQENVNPFSPAFKAQLASGFVSRPATVEEESTGDLSMDETRVVGGILKAPAPAPEPVSSPLGDGTMDLTQAVGKIQASTQVQASPPRTGQKRRRSTTEAGSPGAVAPAAQPKRHRSSVARSSMGDDTMDLTMAIGGIQKASSPAKPERRKSAARRRSSGVASEQDEATMEFTQAVGGIRQAGRPDQTASSFDENEELTMELTTVLGGIRAAEHEASDQRPVTPQSRSPPKSAANTTPKDQERFKDAPDSGPKKLLTPMFEKQILRSAEKLSSSSKSRESISPAVRRRTGVTFAEPSPDKAAQNEQQASEDELNNTTTPKESPPKAASPQRLPPLGDHKSPLRATPTQGSARKHSSATPDSALTRQLEDQIQASEPSPIVQKQQRSSPVKPPATPEKADEPTQDGRRLAESIKLMSTPRKETLKTVTPKKQTPGTRTSPQKALTPRARPTPRNKAKVNESPAWQLSDDLQKIQENNTPAEKIQLQKFLDMAGIRFMDLTTTKRRMTTAPTPSKARKAGDIQDEPEVSLETAILAGGCTLPELEMYEHACHELKRYISDGKRVIKELENETAKETPPLIQAYSAAAPNRKAALDTQMRDIKTHARYRSKEMWYAWRSQLLEDLMKALQGIGEGLIKDDEKLQHAEQILDQVLPALIEQQQKLQAEAENLEQEAAATSEEEKEELEAARERLLGVDEELAEKQRMLQELQEDMRQQETAASDLEENRAEFAAAIKEADRVKESCRSVSTNEITALKGMLTSATFAFRPC